MNNVIMGAEGGKEGWYRGEEREKEGERGERGVC